MNLTSTSTPFLILQNDVEHLWDAFSWVVGGIGITVAVAIILVGIIQTNYQRKKNKIFAEAEMKKVEARIKEIEERMLANLERALELKLNSSYEQFKNELSVAVEEVTGKINNNKTELKEELKSSQTAIESVKNEVTGELARSFANYNHEKGLFCQALNWWLSAAVNYMKSENEFVDISLKAALDSARKIDKEDKSATDFLFERMEQNESYLASLATKYPERVKLIREEIKKKMDM